LGKSSSLRQPKKHLQQASTLVVDNQTDHILLGGALPLLNFTWFNERLGNLDGFDGFAPRTLYPEAIFGTGLKNVTNLLLIVDCLQE